MTPNSYQPDFETDCRICGTSPCVHVAGHPQPDTELCGPHFFDDPLAKQWTEWNDRYQEDSQ